MRAYFALAGLRKPAAFFSWLLGIAWRVARETHRDNCRHRNLDLRQIESPAQPSRDHVCADAELAEAVANLPDVYREVVVRRFYGGQSCAEIGSDLDVQLGTITKRLSRSYALLREHFGSKTLQRESEVSQ